MNKIKLYNIFMYLRISASRVTDVTEPTFCPDFADCNQMKMAVAS